MARLFAKMVVRFIYLLDRQNKLDNGYRRSLFYLIIVLIIVNAVSQDIMRQGSIIQTLFTGEQLFIIYTLEHQDSFYFYVGCIASYIEMLFPAIIGLTILHIYSWFGKSKF